MGIGSMLITLALGVLIFYAVFERQAEEDLRLSAGMIAAAYEHTPEAAISAALENQSMRIVLLSPAGELLFENVDQKNSEDFAVCPEVQSALQTGEGKDGRRSALTHSFAYFYATRLDDGAILRVSIDARSWEDLFRSALPALLFCCILIVVIGSILSTLLTKSLVQPIVKMGNRLEEIDRDVPYPELRPFAASIIRDRAMRQENEAMRQEFTANVSHELKTPLTSISGYAELIENGMVKPEDIESFAGKIHKEAGRLLHLVNDIIELSKLDTFQHGAQSNLDFEWVDLREIVAACAENLTVNAQRAYVTLLYRGESTMVWGNRAAIEDVCVNLCDNAIRYNKPGGKVFLSCGIQEGAPYLRIRDTGIGIPEEQQERVFERFYRVDKSRSKATGGTGLGLAIVKHVAAIHGARIELHSEIGQGTDIRLAFQPQQK